MRVRVTTSERFLFLCSLQMAPPWKHWLEQTCRESGHNRTFGVSLQFFHSVWIPFSLAAWPCHCCFALHFKLKDLQQWGNIVIKRITKWLPIRVRAEAYCRSATEPLFLIKTQYRDGFNRCFRVHYLNFTFFIHPVSLYICNISERNVLFHNYINLTTAGTGYLKNEDLRHKTWTE